MYRKEIEGLRALAVAAVLLFHLDLPFAKGGFVGVDIFFVISGFLITGNIRREREAGEFSFGRFYLKRVRRLFPALAVTIALTLLVAFFTLLPEHAKALAASALASVFSVSNILFYTQAGYFDSADLYKPLLHTWSLGVEEQFYLVWPVLIALLVWSSPSKVRQIISAVVVAMVFGVALAASEAMTRANPSAAFYLTPFRIFEFAIGAFLAFLPRISDKIWPLRVPLFIAGIVAICGCAFLYSSRTPFPGVWALGPCLGAAGVILAGDAPVVGRLLSNPLSRGIGAISYSLYLVHWPIVIFWKYKISPRLELADQAILIAACLGAAVILFFAVERPFRSGIKRSKPVSLKLAGILCAVVAIAISATSVEAWASEGWRFRLPEALRGTKSSADRWAERNASIKYGTCFITEQMGFKKFDSGSCLKIEDGRPNYLVVGDSLGSDAASVLAQAYPGIHVLQATVGNCKPILSGDRAPTCRNMLDSVLKGFAASNAGRLSGVILSASWLATDIDPLSSSTISGLRSLGVRVAVVGDVPRYPEDISAIISRSGGATLADVEAYVQKRVGQFEGWQNDQFISRLGPDVSYIDLYRLICAPECRVFTPQGQWIYVDNMHLTADGASYVAKRLAARDPKILRDPRPQ